MHKFVRIQEVDEWRMQLVKEELRYKVLVLCGASKMKKTEFATRRPISSRKGVLLSTTPLVVVGGF